MAEAAEKRLHQEEARGLKDPEGYKRKIQQREKLEANLASNSSSDAPLKVLLILDKGFSFKSLFVAILVASEMNHPDSFFLVS